jgi:hypothetical protein
VLPQLGCRHYGCRRAVTFIGRWATDSPKSVKSSIFALFAEKSPPAEIFCRCRLLALINNNTLRAALRASLPTTTTMMAPGLLELGLRVLTRSSGGVLRILFFRGALSSGIISDRGKVVQHPGASRPASSSHPAAEPFVFGVGSSRGLPPRYPAQSNTRRFPLPCIAPESAIALTAADIVLKSFSRRK